MTCHISCKIKVMFETTKQFFRWTKITSSTGHWLDPSPDLRLLRQSSAIAVGCPLFQEDRHRPIRPHKFPAADWTWDDGTHNRFRGCFGRLSWKIGEVTTCNNILQISAKIGHQWRLQRAYMDDTDWYSKTFERPSAIIFSGLAVPPLLLTHKTWFWENRVDHWMFHDSSHTPSFGNDLHTSHEMCRRQKVSRISDGWVEWKCCL